MGRHLAGGAVLVERGACTFETKLVAAAAGNASLAIVANNQPGVPLKRTSPWCTSQQTLLHVSCVRLPVLWFLHAGCVLMGEGSHRTSTVVAVSVSQADGIHLAKLARLGCSVQAWLPP